MNKEDMTIICRDCGKEFTFTAGEQAFYATKELQSPIRCKDCRNARKARYEEKKPVEKSATKEEETFADMYARYQQTTIKFEDQE